MTRIGPHFDPPLALLPERLNAEGWNTFQTTLRSPHRLSKDGIPDTEDQAAFLQSMPSLPNWWGMAHASLLTNLAAPDARIRHGSAGALVADANLAATLGLSGVCFHVGYQKGHDTRARAHQAVSEALIKLLPRLEQQARILLENGCEGTELGQSIEELGIVVRAVAADPAHLGITLDTCHLHVAGFDLAAPDAPERLADQIVANGLAPYLTSLHLNDAREPCGSHRDRHAAPGEGTINEGLRRLIRHPLFAPLPAILEISAGQVAGATRYLLAP